MTAVLRTLVVHGLVGLERLASGMAGDLVSLWCRQIAVRAKDRGLPVLLGLGQVSVKIISGESQAPQGGLFHTSPAPMCVAARGSSTTVVCPGVAGEGLRTGRAAGELASASNLSSHSESMAHISRASLVQTLCTSK